MNANLTYALSCAWQSYHISLVCSFPSSPTWLFFFSTLLKPAFLSSPDDLAPYFAKKIEKTLLNLSLAKSVISPVWVPASRPSVSLWWMNPEIPFKCKPHAQAPIFHLLLQDFASVKNDLLFLSPSPFFSPATHVAFGSSHARDQTWATAVTQAAAVTTPPDP